MLIVLHYQTDRCSIQFTMVREQWDHILLPLLIDRRLLTHIGSLGWRDRLLPTWGLGFLAILLVLYGQSNLTYEDKSFYLPSRSPASAACLRNYQSAPTYCEFLVFQRSPGQPSSLRQLGQPLDRHQLSVLAPDQEWTLQGDYGLGRVQWEPDSQLGRVSWVHGEQDRAARWIDFHHLAALVPPGQSIRWQLDLPGGLQSAHFKSEISAASSGMCLPGQVAPSFWISIENHNGELHPLWRFDNICMLDGGRLLDLNLSAYAGQQVTLVLAVSSTGPGTPAARLNYPRLLLRGVPASTSSAALSQPLNTDLSPNFPTIDETAYRLAVQSHSGWQFDHLSQDGPAGRYIKSSTSAAARVALATPACLEDWSQFYVQAAMPNSYRRKLMQVRFTYQSTSAQPGEIVRDLPLLEGEELHTYSINLDLASFPLDACITSVELLLNYSVQPSATMWVELQEAGFFPRYH